MHGPQEIHTELKSMYFTVVAHQQTSLAPTYALGRMNIDSCSAHVGNILGRGTGSYLFTVVAG